MADESSNSELRELRHRIERLEKDHDRLAAHMDDYLLKPVYDAHHQADVAEIKRIDQEAEADRTAARATGEANRTTARTAILTALATFLATLALEAINQWLRAGGH